MTDGWSRALKEAKAVHYYRYGKRLCGTDATWADKRTRESSANPYGRSCTQCVALLVKEGHSHFVADDLVAREGKRSNCPINWRCSFCGTSIVFMPEGVSTRFRDENGGERSREEWSEMYGKPVVFASDPQNWPAGEP